MLVYILVLVLTILLFRSFKKPNKFPPGPPKLPIIGSLAHLTGENGKLSLFHGIRNLVNKHGKVMGLYMGRDPFVVISDYDILKRLLKMDETVDRPHTKPFNEVRWGADHPGLDGRSLGLLLSQGEVWKEQRRFVSRHLRDFGFGKTSMEDMLHVEVEKVISFLNSRVGTEMSLHGALNLTIVNSLWSLMVGEKLELEDPRLKEVVTLLNKFVKNASPQSPLALLLPSPSMLKLPILRDISGLAMWNTVLESIQNMIGVQIKSHSDKLDGSEPGDLLDVLLDHVQKTEDQNSSFYGKTGTDSINNIILDLFLAGVETTASTLVWTFLYMLHYEEVQENVYREISKVVGTDRLPSFMDQDSMPYTNAVILESLRITGFVYLGLPHYTSKDIPVGDFIIPSGTTILPNLHYIMNDPEYFKEPHKFNPSRFIDQDGRFVKDERVIAFSIGKRYCLGQSLAEKQLFLFFSAIVQNFKMKRVEGSVLPNFDVEARDYKGILRTSPQYEIILEKR